MRYVSEMVETSPIKADVDLKVKTKVEQMVALGYHLVSRSYVGRAWAVLVFEAN